MATPAPDTATDNAQAPQQQKAESKSPKKQQKDALKKEPSQRLLLMAVHILCLVVYLIPLFTHNNFVASGDGGAVLDETHIVSIENADVMGTSTLRQVFTNDYWGRPMNSHSSHKSWRPLTILSFRYFKGPFVISKSATPPIQQLYMHRLFNIVTHAATAECVSILAMQIFGNSLLLRILTKLLFAFHPTHVEVTANAANRPHLLATLWSVLLGNPDLHIGAVLLLQIVGLLSSETFIVQMPAVVMTLVLITWNRQRQSRGDNWKSCLFHTVTKLLPRVILLFLLSISYLALRWQLDWLKIPKGLIRPAENPFYELTGLDRVRNYIYVLAIHIYKSWALDFVGFSHEYGFDCIQQVQDYGDPRMIVVYILVGVLAYSLYACFRNTEKKQQSQDSSRAARILDNLFVLAFHVGWMVTLFPISGLMRVGTFIADRIAVGSTVSVSILAARWLSGWMQQSKRIRQYFRGGVVALLLLFLYRRVHVRTLDWMGSIPLLQSSLVTCPRSAKSHLEISKVYSGLVMDKLDLDKSLHHLEVVQDIDPTYCDVHQQLAHVYIQQQRYLEFEEHLTQAILCPFSMGGATEMWKRYWPIMLENPSTAQEAQQRMQKYTSQIEAAVQREQEFGGGAMN